MFSRFMPKEGHFFKLFNAHADEIVTGAKALVVLMQAVGQNDAQVAKSTADIDDSETRADSINHEVMALMHATFITPLDRDEIHQLISHMDDVLDTIQDVAETMSLYDIVDVTPEARKLAELSLSCAERVRSAVALLSNMDNGQTILKTCREIDELESDADRVLRSALSRLFREEQDVRQVLKFKGIYELLESITDRCEDVAKILEAVVLENS
ncbi:DUF47 domain-containing protein [Azoarcus sp. KH32C]|uniref:DUF47 domain-containing protein n=1 Tax=Azoarcus sp. KH32C TaxID=748247 RepID=UPI00023865B7|nr:DUF47 family protein [Azoarcus sp. KH32C]BAL23124.1 hypothetical protein AZKH_0785 [Azoarcus sp. KH32C]